MKTKNLLVCLISSIVLISCDNGAYWPGHGSSSSHNAPGSFSITKCEQSGSTVELEWTSSEYAEYYSVEYEAPDEYSYSAIMFSVYGTSYTHYSPDNGYCMYRVIAHNNYGETSAYESCTFSSGSSGGGTGGSTGGSTSATSGTVSATVYASGPGVSYSSYAQWVNGKTTTVEWVWREGAGSYYIYGGTYCSDPDANSGKGVLYKCSTGYNSVRVDGGYMYDSYHNAQFYDIYLRFTLNP